MDTIVDTASDTASDTAVSDATDHTPLTEVRSAHRFDEQALVAYMRSQVPDFEGPLEIRQFEGGQSNPTFLLESPSGKYVLRKQPPGELLPSAHQVDREYRVMHGLGQVGAPVPQMLSLCRDRSIIGTDFYLMAWVDGRVFSEPTLPGLEADHRREIYLDLARVLGGIHNVDYRQVGLEGFGRPANYVARQLSRWSKQYLLAKTEDIESMERLMAWLPKHIPDEDGDESLSTIVHGDYRVGNVIVHASEPRVVAVLDWELSTIGNPLSDLSYLCQQYHIGEETTSAISGVNPELPGIPSEGELIDAYCEVVGREGVDNWGFYIAYNMFRSASITQGVYKRGLDGNASSDSAKLYADGCRLRADCGWAFVEALNQ